MKKIILILYALVMCCIVNAQILRPFTVRYNNPSVRGNIIQVANNIFTSVGGQSAGNPGNTTEAPPGGTSANNGAPGRNINIDAMVPFGSTWKYLTGTGVTPAGVAPPLGWNTLAFGDGAWPSANGELGYGDGDETTCIPSGGGGTLCVPTGNKYTTTYFRKTINIANPLAFTNFRFKVERDDGFVLYVNGVELSRNNMPGGAINNTTFASATFNDVVTTFTVPNTAFAIGNNVIAVEIHQNTASDNDLSFNLELTGLTGTSNDIFSSSTADLNLPSCSQVLFAGLYWGATQGTNGTNTLWIVNETTVKLKLPGSAVYQNVTSTQTDYHNNTLVPGLPHTGYRCFANITNLINTTNPNGTYGIANMAAPEAVVNGAGGWTIVIAYADPATIVRDLTIFDGSAIMNGGDPALDVPITGFLTPPTGPVSCELGAVVYDGDRVSVDAYKFKQDANPLVGVYTDLTPNATSNFGDMWNSTISRYGVNIPARNPAHQNTLGYDADIITVPNAANAVLGNSATSASIRFESPSENYFIHTVSTAISEFNPSYSLTKTSTDLNGGVLAPGDILRYQLSFRNFGNDNSINTIIRDNLPFNVGFVPGSLRINGLPYTDAGADDVADYDPVNRRVIFRIGTGANGLSGGNIAPGVNGTVTFDVVAASSCAILACGSTINNIGRVDYTGQTSLVNFYDSSRYDAGGGCFSAGPVINTITGACFTPVDTTLVNICPAGGAMLPWARYAGYTFYSAQPFITANIFNPTTLINATGTYWAYVNTGVGCADTIPIYVLHQNCPDLDEDDDGIPDYVELNNPVALQDHDSDGIPNWNDTSYPGWIDNNTDGLNDNFDPGADADNDGVVNFMDPNWPSFTDTDSDGINDNLDKDKDGIPNYLDRDSDNDGIPDVVESFGVDANGDGRIDNFTDPDSDGFSQNVDGAAGVAGSGNGLGGIDTDGDGIPNYLDLDSDNDGIPDIVEVYGTDADNNGRLDSFTDIDLDGYADNVDGDVGNDGTAENSSNSLLLTGADVTADGRADSYPSKNLDRDFRPNAYDIDADSDGIVDVIEAGLPDANLNGIVDGAINADGWSATVAAMPVLNLRNTDAAGNFDYIDIDADDDGIPDNIEGMSTVGYIRPVSLTDTDGDGLVNHYDNVVGFGGSGIFVYDHDGDGIPDYRDLDTDADGQPDIIEGNDFNLNGFMDDIVSLTGLDTDGDGLDNRFDSLNSVTNLKGTSYMMGTGGTLTGDPAPGTRATVQKRVPAQSDRDWRSVGVVLPVDFLKFTGTPQDNQVHIGWTIIALKEIDHFEIERSIDNTTYTKVGLVSDAVKLNQEQSFIFTDDITGLNSTIIYYRLKVIGKGGEIKYSNILVVRKTSLHTDVAIMPNPASNYISINLYSDKNAQAQLILIDKLGRKVLEQKGNLIRGNNKIYLPLNKYAEGVYAVIIETAGERVVKQFIISR
ncbi:T9SS type A sorting domain-containing protein [Ferruginibacter sp.]